MQARLRATSCSSFSGKLRMHDAQSNNRGEAYMSTGFSRLLVRGVVVVAFAGGPLSALAQDATDEGKKVVDATCNTCHPIAARTGSGYTPEGWDTVLHMMMNHGVPVSADKLSAG